MPTVFLGLTPSSLTGKTPTTARVGSKDQILTDVFVPKQWPEIFSKIPLSGEFSLSLDFESHPTAQLNFVTVGQAYEYIIKALKPGTLVILFEVSLRVRSVSINRKKSSSFPLGILEVGLSLKGAHEFWLEKEVPIQEKLSSTGFCGESTEVQVTGKIAVPELVRRAGGRLTGVKLVDIPITSQTQPTDSTTPQSAISERLRQEAAFVDYFSDSVEVKKFWGGLTRHKILEGEITSDISLNINDSTYREQKFIAPNFKWIPDQPPNLSGAPNTAIAPAIVNEPVDELYPYAAHLWPKTKIDGDFNRFDSNPDNRRKTNDENLKQGKEWKRQPRKEETIEEADENAHIAPSGDMIKDVGLCFDSASDKIKISHVVTLWDGVKVEEVTRKYGFVFYGSQLYQTNGTLTGIAPSSAWVLIEQVTTKHFFSTEELGFYHLGFESRGFKLARYKKESQEKPETLQYQDDPNRLALYKFFSIPIYEIQGKLLEPFQRYYNDPTPEWDIREICLPNGQKKRIAVNNPTYSPSFFVSTLMTIKNGIAFTQNPDYNQDDWADPDRRFSKYLIAGVDSYEDSRVKILRSSKIKTANALGGQSSPNPTEISLTDSLSDEERYSEYKQSATSGESGFSSSVGNAEVSLSQGRPPECDKLPSLYKEVEPEPTDGVEDKEDLANKQWIAWTPHSPAYFDQPANLEILSGSQSFPYATKIGEVKAALETTLEIEDFRNSIEESMDLLLTQQRLEMRPGDYLTYSVASNGQEIVCQRRIKSVSFSGTIQGAVKKGVVVTGRCQLTLGLARKIPVQIDSEDLPPTPEQLNDVERFLLWRNVTQGELPNPSQPSRMNF